MFSYSDRELLALIVGKRTASKLLLTGSLMQILTSDHPKLIAVIELARRALREQIDRGTVLTTPQATRDYLRLMLSGRENEVFVAIFLTAQNKVIEYKELFTGSLTQTSVYPRPIVQHALRINAGAIIFAHNHPSGVAEPSRADEALTQALKQALALVDVKVLDHFVVGSGSAMSFAERGLL